jgi:transcriptional regulator with PAS, ATPase and Fis domain
MNTSWITKSIQDGLGYADIMRTLQYVVVTEALTLTKGNKSHAAQMLNVSRNNFARWAKAQSGK